MKRFLVVVTAMMLAVGSLSAVEFNWKQLGDLYKAKDYATLESTAVAMKSSAKGAPSKGAVILYTVLARQNLKKYSTSAAALADIDALAKELNVSVDDDNVRTAKLLVLNVRGEQVAAIEMSKDWKGPNTLYRRAHLLYYQKRYAEAADDFFASNKPGSAVAAANMARIAKLPEKIYEYSYKALNDGNINDPAVAIKLVNGVLDANFSGTTITPAKIKEFLQMVNRKYSRKLVVNAPTKWDSLIQLVRQTLETY